MRSSRILLSRPGALLCTTALLVLMSCASESLSPDDPTPHVPPQIQSVCTVRCEILSHISSLLVQSSSPDSANALLLLAEFRVAGDRGSRLGLVSSIDKNLRAIAGLTALVIQAGESRRTISMSELPDSLEVYTFLRKQEVSVKYWLRRGMRAYTGGTITIAQTASAVTFLSARTPWGVNRQAGPLLTPGASTRQSCGIVEQSGECGLEFWEIDPYATETYWGVPTFQSGGGTGASDTVTVTFSAPVPKVRITVHDPTYSGNTATAYNGSQQLGSVSFPYSGQPGVNNPATDSLTGSITRVVLAAAGGDYVAYAMEVALAVNVRVRITFQSGTPRLVNNTVLILPAGLTDTMGPVPQYQGNPWPAELTFSVSVDSGGIPVPNRNVILTFRAVDSVATGADSMFGHVHHGANNVAKPRGTLSDTSFNTGGTGLATVSFTPPIISGPVRIMGFSTAADTLRETILVGVPLLANMVQRPSDSLIGGPGTVHPDNHWGTGEMIVRLNSLADSVYSRYNGKRLHYNDMSLQWGGKFDLDETWAGRQHALHRLGRDIDLRTNVSPGVLSGAQLTFVRRRWQNLGGFILDERSSGAPHFHLAFRQE